MSYILQFLHVIMALFTLYNLLFVIKCNKLKYVIGNVLFKNNPKWTSKNVNENSRLKTDSG